MKSKSTAPEADVFTTRPSELLTLLLAMLSLCKCQEGSSNSRPRLENDSGGDFAVNIYPLLAKKRAAFLSLMLL